MERHARVRGPAGELRDAVVGALRAAGIDSSDDHARPDLTVLIEDAAAPPWPPPPVIVVSTRTDIDSFTNAITSGAAAYFTAPIDRAELTAAAERLARWQPAPLAGNTRRSARRPLLLDVDVAAGAKRMRGRLVDVSASGCRVELQGTLRRGEEVTLTPHALGESTGIALGAVVTWTRRGAPPSPATCVAAMRFVPTTALLAGRIFGVRR